MVKKLWPMQASRLKIKSRGNTVRFPPFSRLITFSIALVWAVLACSKTTYWIPPASTPTVPPEIAFLLSTPDPAILTPSPTPQEVVLPTPQKTSASHSSPELVALPTLSESDTPILYYAQAADTLPVVALRFGVKTDEITSPDPLPATSILTPGQLLIIPRRIANTTTAQHVLPDSELVYSPSAADFDIVDFVNKAGGKLSTYDEWTKTYGLKSGAEVIQRVALENSINPRLLLALLEYHSHWVYGQPTSQDEEDYPLGYVEPNHKGLFRQLVWAVDQLSIGYYSWREGRLSELYFKRDGYKTRLAPDLNAGSVALQYYFAQLFDTSRWLETMELKKGFPALYEQMYDNPWQRALKVEPLYPPGLEQPPMTLPFEMKKIWSFTGGPHGSWEQDGSYAALDFAPASSMPGCVDSNAWVTASASGVVARSAKGVLVLDLDGDGREETGWVLLYLHVSSESSLPVGSWVEVGTHLGHPSCEGGHATGTHVHIARKFNGEWIAAGGPMPFVLSGWVAYAGEAAYKGYLLRGEDKIKACTCSTHDTFVQRTEEDPY